MKNFDFGTIAGTGCRLQVDLLHTMSFTLAFLTILILIMSISHVAQSWDSFKHVAQTFHILYRDKLNVTY